MKQTPYMRWYLIKRRHARLDAAQNPPPSIFQDYPPVPEKD